MNDNGYNYDNRDNTNPKGKNINEIIQEYRIKMNSFNPDPLSPNLFTNKLEYRLRTYYNLYKSKKTYKK